MQILIPESKEIKKSFLSRLYPSVDKNWMPRSDVGWSVLKSLPFLPKELAEELVDAVRSIVVIESKLSLVHYPAYELPVNYGVVSHKVVTDAGVAFIVDAFQNTTELENLKFHGLGTGTTAEAVTQTGLITELTTAYTPDNTRATGTTTEAAANIYRTVATNTVDAAAAVTEHGIFSQAATGGGTLLDRSVFSVVNLASGDSLQSTYDLTLTAGG